VISSCGLNKIAAGLPVPNVPLTYARKIFPFACVQRADVVRGEAYSPFGQELAQAKLPLRRRFDVDGAVGVVGV
jgi:hypothetical protein